MKVISYGKGTNGIKRLLLGRCNWFEQRIHNSDQQKIRKLKIRWRCRLQWLRNSFNGEALKILEQINNMMKENSQYLIEKYWCPNKGVEKKDLNTTLFFGSRWYSLNICVPLKIHIEIITPIVLGCWGLWKVIRSWGLCPLLTPNPSHEKRDLVCLVHTPYALSGVGHIHTISSHLTFIKWAYEQNPSCCIYKPR